ncbi:hypothetical protein AMTRI_Chr01g111770 [Amborella trichopoda]|uniref:Cyclic phosphodiesterase n=2 Tax=Amborella trichopoda TaxID=13333 RepID=W1Q0U1_AMBTC|nr:hypothetical protein AMTR_s00021p00250770 [Amborella trichopoda]
MEEEHSYVYSVWAIPPLDVKLRLKALMEKLRDEFGGPEFEPHVTVVGATRLTEKDAMAKLEACKELKPYKCRAIKVDKGSFFYQCVYLLLDPTPEMMEVNAHCIKHFGCSNATPYMPHLSLLYGDLTEEEKKKAQDKANSLDQGLCNLDFEVSSLALHKTDTEDKTLKSWEKVAEIPLRERE